jgi:hypothetical protein
MLPTVIAQSWSPESGPPPSRATIYAGPGRGIYEVTPNPPGCNSFQGWDGGPLCCVESVMAGLALSPRSHAAWLRDVQAGHMSVIAWLDRHPQPAPYAFDVYSLFSVPPTDSWSGAPHMPVGVTRFS